MRTAGGFLEVTVDNTHKANEAVTEMPVDKVLIEGNLVDLPRNGATDQVTLRLENPGTSTGNSARPSHVQRSCVWARWDLRPSLVALGAAYPRGERYSNGYCYPFR